MPSADDLGFLYPGEQPEELANSLSEGLRTLFLSWVLKGYLCSE